MVDEETLHRWRDVMTEQRADGDATDHTGFRNPHLPWDFETSARNLALTADRVLDIAAGDGELLTRLSQALPERTAAIVQGSELFAAQARLEPLGIEVIDHDADSSDAPLPCDDRSFDLVLCRHHAFDAREVARVLSPGGAFLTQQVGSGDLEELRTIFGLTAPLTDLTLSLAERRLTEAGLSIERSDVFHGHYEFHDVPAVLRSLRRTPGATPAHLDVDHHLGVLEELAGRMQDGPLLVTASRFIVLAHTPPAIASGRVDFADLPIDDLDVPQV